MSVLHPLYAAAEALVAQERAVDTDTRFATSIRLHQAFSKSPWYPRPRWVSERPWFLLIVGILALLPTLAHAQMVQVHPVSMPVAYAYVEQFSPPAEYRTWYEEMQACSAVQGPAFEQITFYAVDANTFLMQGHRVIGWGDKTGRTVWLARWSVGVRKIVAHELLHIILGPGHPTVPWAFPCGVD